MVALVWFRNDLRLSDHRALDAAIKTDQDILPIYIYDQDSSRPLGGAAKWWLHRSLSALQKSLQDCDADIIFRKGDSLDVLKRLHSETKFTHIFWHDRYDNSEIKQDREIQQYFESIDVKCESFNGTLIFQSKDFKTREDTPFKVFSPYWKYCVKNGDVGEPTIQPSTIKYYKESKVDSEQLSSWELLPTKPNWAKGFDATWQPGEQGAQKLFKEFLKSKLTRYKHERDKPAALAISDLSPHIRWGEISPRQLWHDVNANAIIKNCAESSECFLKELCWREFSYYTLYHYPEIKSKPLNKRFENFPWKENAKLFEAWSYGNTGYPIVDAGMKQLWKTGYMHNRVRLITASFLVKNLLISWQEGEKWFWDTLVDADQANNNFNWQWVAGYGSDASPYFRVFNPILQSKKFDENGEYIRAWVPELSKVSNEFIHEPWLMDRKLSNYPSPVVDFYKTRDETLEVFAKLF